MTTTKAVAPWAERLIAEFTAADEWAKRLVRPLNPAQLNWRPAAGEWSVGQCVEHLAAASEVYLPPIIASLAGQPRLPTPVADIRPGWFGRWFIRNFAAPVVRGRHWAPRKIKPSDRRDIDARVLDRFLAGNEQAREVVRLAQDYDVNRIRFKNPFVWGIRFTAGTGLEILSQHERRHLHQAERVRAVRGFP